MQSSLRHKIIELFEYRSFPELLELGGMPSSMQDQFTEDLIQLQAAIYYLDHHLETNWNVDLTRISDCWDDIYKAMKPFDLNHEEKVRLTAHIRKYQKHELELRQQLFPNRFKMEFFYFYKSCDVKLLRHLIYKRLPQLKKLANFGDWRYFDLITEVNDDVEDVFEDCTTINGNSFLLSLLLRGRKHTVQLFQDFVDYSIQMTEERFEGQANPCIKLITTKSCIEYDHTRSLIEKNAIELTKIEQSDIKIAAHIDQIHFKVISA